MKFAVSINNIGALGERLFPDLIAFLATAFFFLALPVLNRAISPPRRDFEYKDLTVLKMPVKLPASATDIKKDEKTIPVKIQLPDLPEPSKIPMKLEIPVLDYISGPPVSVSSEGAQITDFLNRLDFNVAWETEELDQMPQPLSRLDPVYPPRARLRRIEGTVILQFVVNPDGTTDSIEVVSSMPAGVFDSSAISAVERWRFRPGLKNGRPVAARVRQKITFKMED